MDELIDAVSMRLGIDRAVAERAIGVVLGLVKQHGDADKVQQMFDQLPGADAMAAQYGERSGGLFGAFSSVAGPVVALSKLKAAGLSAEQSKELGRQVLAHAKAKCGEPLVKDVARSIPGMSAFV
ncbi:DUF2267 domain-containing protein [Rhodoligotrophos defluvii]|uniref:DUF2267 domain-containing protein n=1 Tax=Rhodoligotrophos defluvii TaxID=2561934 RepID=UPI0010C9C7FF|nr:DUF2267 domain-containing protein [Rhodoligotrophos defluvii]